MYFLLGKEIGNGYFDYVSDIERMGLTDDPSRAQQISEAELDMFDMDYLMEQGFYALEIDRFGLRFSPVLLFRPPIAHYRPLPAPKKSGEMVVRPPRHIQKVPPRPSFDGARPPRKSDAPRGPRPEGRPGSAEGRPGVERRSGPDDRPARGGRFGSGGFSTPGRRPTTGRRPAPDEGSAPDEQSDARPGGRYSSFAPKQGRRPDSADRPGGFGGKPGSSDRPGGFGGKLGPSGKPGGFKGKPGSSDKPGGFGGKPGSSGKPGGFKGKPGSSGKPGGFGGKSGPSGRPGGRDPHMGGGNRGGHA